MKEQARPVGSAEVGKGRWLRFSEEALIASQPGFFKGLTVCGEEGRIQDYKDNI